MILGDPLIWTPSAVKAELDRIRAVLDTINSEVSQAANDKKVSGDEWNQWYKVYKAGHDFVDNASTLWGSNVTAARQYEQEAGKWHTLVVQRGVAAVGPSNLVRDPNADTGLGLNPLTIGLVIGGLLAVGYVVHAVRR